MGYICEVGFGSRKGNGDGDGDGGWGRKSCGGAPSHRRKWKAGSEGDPLTGNTFESVIEYHNSFVFGPGVTFAEPWLRLSVSVSVTGFISAFFGEININKTPFFFHPHRSI